MAPSIDRNMEKAQETSSLDGLANPFQNLDGQTNPFSNLDVQETSSTNMEKATGRSISSKSGEKEGDVGKSANKIKLHWSLRIIWNSKKSTHKRLCRN